MQTLARPRRKALVSKRNKRALLITIGAASLGGILPAISYHVAHYQAPSLFTAPWGPSHGLWLVVAGLLAYSAPSVAQWFARYSSPVKAWGFVVGLECAMTCTAQITALPALLALVIVNAIVLSGRMSQD